MSHPDGLRELGAGDREGCPYRAASVSSAGPAFFGVTGLSDGSSTRMNIRSIAATVASPLHEGETVEWLTPDILAAPWWRVI